MNRERVLEECEKKLKLSNQRLLFKLSGYTEDDVLRMLAKKRHDSENCMMSMLTSQSIFGT